MTEVGGYMGGPGDNFSADPGSKEQRATDAQVYGAFKEDRWRRVGATDDEVAALRDKHEAMSIEEQGEEGKRLATLHDDMLAQELQVMRDSGGNIASSPFNGTIKEVEAHVGDDPVLAQQALAFEQSAFGQKRKSLIRTLEKVAAGPADDETAEGNQDDDGNA